MKKKRNIYIILALIVILVLIVLLLLVPNLTNKKSKDNILSAPTNNTEIGENTTGYKLDLRIFGTYKNRAINEIVMVTNYKNTDKEIRLTSINGNNTLEKQYFIKENKNYELVDETLKEVNNVPYSDTDIYLEGVKNITELNEKGKEQLGDNEYTIYIGKVSKKIMNKMLDKTQVNINVETDADAEVWLTNDNHIYKVYYKAEGITLYPSYFGYNKFNEIDLSMYGK